MSVEMNQDQIEQLHNITAENLRHLSDDITQNITDNVQRLLEEARQGRVAGSNQSRIKEQCENVNKCDGTLTEEIREWLKCADLAVRNTGDIDQNVHRITRKTTGGQLFRSIEAQLRANPNITWDQLKTYVSDSFLGTNETERLRLEISQIKQGADSILMFNRKFREMAETVYGVVPRGQQVERILIRHYIMAVSDKELARKIITESNLRSIENVLEYADKFATGIVLYQTMFPREEPMDISVVNPLVPERKNKEVDNLKRQIERQNTKIAKLEAQVHQGQVQNKTTEGVCYYCGRQGHYKSNCPNIHQRRRFNPPIPDYVQGRGHGRGNRLN